MRFLPIIALLLGVAYAAPPTITAHRALQLDAKLFSGDKTAVEALGPRKAAARGTVVVVRSASDLDTVAGKFAIVDAAASESDFAARVLEKQPAAVLFVAPAGASAVERAVTSAPQSFPVFFANASDPQLAGVLASAAGDAAMMVAQVAVEPVALAQRSKLGLLTARLGPANAAHKIALVTHADTLGVAPSLVAGYDAGSGAVAALEVLRLLSKLKWDASTKDPSHSFSITVVIGTAGRHSYQSTREWIQNGSRQDAFDFVVCLESVAKPGKLFLHEASETADLDAGAGVKSTFVEHLKKESAFADLQASVRKINAHSKQLAFEHESFATRSVPAVTLTSLPAAVSQHQRSGLGDTASTAAPTAVFAKRIEGLARALARAAKKTDEIGAADAALIGALGKAHESTPRPAVAFPAALLQRYKQLAAAAAPKTTVLKEVDWQPKDVVVYDTWKVELSVYQHTSALFELALTGFIAVYVFSFAAILGGVANAKSAVMSFFGSPKTA